AVRNGIRSLARETDGAAPSPDGPLSPDFRELSPWRSYATMHLWRAAAAAQSAARNPSPNKTRTPPQTPTKTPVQAAQQTPKKAIP
ncbi:MAG TPA: hypothetical protein VK883_15195, partial [Arthrobacter sp.]|nr:hypothetical protein [Arthrobacter sp.]